MDTATLTRPEVERMRAEGRVFTTIAVALSIAAGRLYLLDPAKDASQLWMTSMIRRQCSQGLVWWPTTKRPGIIPMAPLPGGGREGREHFK